MVPGLTIAPRMLSASPPAPEAVIVPSAALVRVPDETVNVAIMDSGQATNIIQVYGTAGVANTFVSAGSYAYMNSGNAFYYISGAKYVYGYAANNTDVAYHYDGSGASALVMSGVQYSFMEGTDHGASFFNEAVGFKTTYGIAQHAGQDTAIFYDSPMDDVFAGYTDYSYLYADSADGSLAYFDKATGFAQVYAYAFVGGTDYAYVYDANVNHTSGFIVLT